MGFRDCQVVAPIALVGCDWARRIGRCYHEYRAAYSRTNVLAYVHCSVMPKHPALTRDLSGRGISRRAFLKFCSVAASVLALPPEAVGSLVESLGHSARLPIIWLSFQECTGCTESFTRSHAPAVEDLLFDYFSLDYHHTLQAPSGADAESARLDSMRRFQGRYLLIVDGSIPLARGGVYSTIGGRTNLAMLKECGEGAAAVIAVGSCAVFGGLPAASPNPTGAVGVLALMEQGLIAKRPLVNLPGCPPLPIAISSVLAHYIAFGRFPAVDDMQRPLSLYGNTVHERCSRFRFFEERKFVKQFDDEGARKGWCLYLLGCRGPLTHNACAVHKWNQGTSFPIESGHPCLGCAEPGFWDRGGFYRCIDETECTVDESHESREDAASEGQNLYEDNCVYCHSIDPGALRTDPNQIPHLLRSGEIRSHRRLQFSDEQLDQLGEYLKSRK